MSNDTVNTIAIQQFLQQVKSADAAQAREVRLDIKNAKALAFSLAEVLNKLTQDYETLFYKLRQSNENAVINVSMDGGGFKDS
jgi:hypothetical protein